MKTILFVLGGWLINDNGIWQTTPVGVAADHGFPTNDSLRVLAAAEYFKQNPDTIIVVSGGKGKLPPTAPTVASVMQRELISLGVPSSAIIMEEKSETTFDQLTAVSSYFFGGNGENVFILSNEWHFPRIDAFVKYGPKELSQALSSVKFMEAEEVLLLCGEKWEEVVRKARNAENIQERIALENAGIKAMQEGAYHFRV